MKKASARELGFEHRLCLQAYLDEVYIPHLPKPMRDFAGSAYDHALDGDLYLIAPNMNECSNYRLGSIMYELDDCLKQIPGIGARWSTDIGYILFTGKLQFDDPPANRLFGDIKALVDTYYENNKNALKTQAGSWRYMRQYRPLPAKLVRDLRIWWLENDGQQNVITFPQWYQQTTT